MASIWDDQDDEPTEVGPGIEPDLNKKPPLEDQLVRSARSIQAEERLRRQQGLGVLSEAFERAQQARTPIDADLLFSRAMDSVGARGRNVLSSMMKNFAGRGIRPGSGAFRGTLSKLAHGMEGQMVGARRDIAIYDQQQRRADAAANMADARTMAVAYGAPVSGVMHSTLQDLFEGQIAREGIQAGVAAQRASSRDRKMGSLGGGLLGLAGSVIGK